MDQLVKESLAYGLLPLVVPEFKTITVGGAVAGGALESSSFRYGQFCDTCIAYEVVCQDGNPMKVSPGCNSDLFYALSGSYGAVGRILRATVQLQESRRGVHVRYLRFSALSDAIRYIGEEVEADYVDGVGLSADCWIVMVGYLCDPPEGVPVGRFAHAWSEWYIDHIASGVEEEWIPIEEYLFRYDRGAFWMGRYMAQPFHQLPQVFWEWFWSKPELAERLSPMPGEIPVWFRRTFGWLMSSGLLYSHLHHLKGDFFFIQDAYLPIHSVQAVIEWGDRRLGIYPVWLCPVKATPTPQVFSPSCQEGPLLLDVGLYGAPRGDVVELTAEFEELVADLGGRKMRYGLNIDESIQRP